MVANSHHAIISVLTFINFYYSTCKNSEEHWAFFSDASCQFTVHPNYVQGGLITAGYLTYDFYIYNFVIIDKNALWLQTQGHHIAGFISTIGAIFTGYHFMACIHLMCCCEVSTIFLNIRSMYDKSQMGRLDYTVVQLIFVFTFIITRMIIMPVNLVLTLYNTLYIWKHLSTHRRIWCVAMEMSCTALYLLNLYWFKFIMIGLLKMLGCMKSSKSKTAAEPEN